MLVSELTVLKNQKEFPDGCFLATGYLAGPDSGWWEGPRTKQYAELGEKLCPVQLADGMCAVFSRFFKQELHFLVFQVLSSGEEE